MTAHKTDAYQTAPEFNEALQRFQAGEWEAGLAKLEGLLVSFPYSKDLRTLFEEMQLRSQIDVYEREDRRQARARKFRKTFFSLAGVVVVISTLVWGGTVFSDVIQGQLDTTTGIIDAQAKAVELEWIYNNAIVLMRAGQYKEAEVLFNQVLARDEAGKYEVLSYLEEIEVNQSMGSEYELAMAYIREGRARDALPILEDLKRKGYNSTDLDLQIEAVNRQLMFTDMANSADTAFAEARWEDAIDSYTKIRGLDPDFRKDYVTNQLFSSYLQAGEDVLAKPEGTLDDLAVAESYFRNALSLKPQDKSVRGRLVEIQSQGEERLFWSFVDQARQALIGRTDSLEALQEAEGYFSAALRLRPGHEQITVERELARRYMSAQDAFNVNNWSTVIEDLEYVLGIDKDYANGTARQTLYEAYLAKGDSQFASGLHELAIADYRTAAVLANQEPGALYRLYEIQLKMANAENILGNYEAAVRLYRQAADNSGFRERAANESPAMVQKVDDAEYYAQNGNYRYAARNYREAFQGLEIVYETINHMVVAGDYLTSIAAKYGSSVSALVDANNISDANRIYVGQELIVPVLRAR
jgi:tetratricopeptide (TPR) repeat protein